MTTPHRDEQAAELRHKAGATSVVRALARYVDDLIQLSSEQIPDYLKGLGAPPGWRIARLQGANVAPARIALYGQRPDGRWEGCETIAVFGFTGEPPEQALRESVARTLHDLGAEDIETHSLAATQIPGVTAARSSGYVTVAGQRFWAQYSTYVADSTAPGNGRLILHSLFIESGCRATLADDIAQLGNAVHHAFLTPTTGTPFERCQWRHTGPSPGVATEAVMDGLEG